MDRIDLLVLLFLDIIVAFLIAKYQQKYGYTFYKSFIGALIGMIGLTLLGIKGWNAL
jgi:hypothetical protein